MKRMKRYILLFGTAALFLSACQSKDNSAAQEAPETITEDQTAENTDMEINENLIGLTEGEYPDLEISAAVLERKAILPGSAVPVTVTVSNNGDKKVVYTLGSGSFETPEALILETHGLQAIVPRDHLGIATADFRTKELMPGETSQYTLYVRAVEPNEQFNDYTYEMWQNDETYIADIEWDELKENYSDLTPVKAGNYDISVYFLYYLPDEQQAAPLQNPTGYSKGMFTLSVAES